MEKPVLSPILLTDDEVAAALGVGIRTFHSLRDAPWMPRPVVLGPRLLRWSRAELEDAVSNMPRQEQRAEPVALARARAESKKQKAGK